MVMKAEEVVMSSHKARSRQEPGWAYFAPPRQGCGAVVSPKAVLAGTSRWNGGMRGGSGPSHEYGRCNRLSRTQAMGWRHAYCH